MSAPCLVLRCANDQRDPGHTVATGDAADATPAATVCPEHWARIEQGEPWLWVPGHGLKGAGSTLAAGLILMGEELLGYGLVVDADAQVSSSEVYSPQIAGGERTRTLVVNGRLFGAPERVSLELVLSPETVTRLREALRFLPT